MTLFINLCEVCSWERDLGINSSADLYTTHTDGVMCVCYCNSWITSLSSDRHNISTAAFHSDPLYLHEANKALNIHIYWFIKASMQQIARVLPSLIIRLGSLYSTLTSRNIHDIGLHVECGGMFVIFRKRIKQAEDPGLQYWCILQCTQELAPFGLNYRIRDCVQTAT